MSTSDLWLPDITLTNKSASLLFLLQATLAHALPFNLLARVMMGCHNRWVEPNTLKLFQPH